MVDRAEFPDIGAYRQFLEAATASNLVHRDLAAVPAPCTTTLVEVPSDDQSDPAVALVTEVCVTGVTLAGLAASTSFMNPANWSTYSYWCHMLPPVSGNPPDPAAAVRFLEAVALDCPAGWFEVAVWLDFSPLVQVPTALIRTYRMSPPAIQGDVVAGQADERCGRHRRRVDHGHRSGGASAGQVDEANPLHGTGRSVRPSR